MLPLFNANDQLDELVFENRNKAYGAYALRKDYPVQMGKSLLIAFSSLFFLFGSITLWNYWFGKNLKNNPAIAVASGSNTKNTAVELSNFAFNTNDLQRVIDDLYTFRIVNKKESELPREIIKRNVNIISTGISGGGAVTGGGFVPGSGGVKPILNGLPVISAPGPGYVDFAEEMPQFKGGLEAFYQYIQHNLVYPDMAKENQISGKVIISFIVSESGKISEVNLEKGIGFGCDEEALKVINQMPEWTCGKQNGKPVAVKMRLPIMFSLN